MILLLFPKQKKKERKKIQEILRTGKFKNRVIFYLPNRCEEKKRS